MLCYFQETLVLHPVTLELISSFLSVLLSTFMEPKNFPVRKGESKESPFLGIVAGGISSHIWSR